MERRETERGEKKERYKMKGIGEGQGRERNRMENVEGGPGRGGRDREERLILRGSQKHFG